MIFLVFIGRLFSLPAVSIKYFLKRAVGPTRLRLILEELGGVYIKLGQILAMRFDLLPVNYATALLDILDNVKPVSKDIMFRVFKKETGKKIEEIFERIEPEPLGTASFAQVYKGVLKGENIVVKIQKPESAKYIQADLFLLKIVFFFVDFFGVLKSVSSREILAQLKEWLSDELDYSVEAQNNKILYEHAKNHNLENVIIPKIYLALTTKKVLVQEFLEGSQVKRIMVYKETRPDDLNKVLAERNINLLKAANAFIGDSMRQYFIDGFFHADPHPANLMIFPESRIGFIDFGIIGRSRYDNFGLLRFIKGAVEMDFRESAEGIVEFLDQRLAKEYGALIAGDKKIQKVYEATLDFITRHLTEDTAPILKDWHFFTGRKESDISERSSARAFLKIAKTVEKYKLKFPPDVIAFLRALVIIDMVCLKLDVNFNMVEAAKLFFEHHSVEDIKAKTPAHQEETKELETLSSLHIAEVAPEKEGEVSARVEEKQYAAKEKLMGLIAALAEKYPELYNEIKDI